MTNSIAVQHNLLSSTFVTSNGPQMNTILYMLQFIRAKDVPGITSASFKSLCKEMIHIATWKGNLSHYWSDRYNKSRCLVRTLVSSNINMTWGPIAMYNFARAMKHVQLNMDVSNDRIFCKKKYDYDRIDSTKTHHNIRDIPI